MIITVSYSVMHSSFKADGFDSHQTPHYSGVAGSISERHMLIYSCSAQLISFQIDSISEKINCAEHEYMNMSTPLISRAGEGTATLP